MLTYIKNKVVAANIHVIIARLKRYEDIAKIDMESNKMPIVSKYGCEVAGSFVGWYLHDMKYRANMSGIEKNEMIFSKGLQLFEREIFGLPENSKPMEDQLDEFIAHSGLWPNKNGIFVFTSPTAYTGEHYLSRSSHTTLH